MPVWHQFDGDLLLVDVVVVSGAQQDQIVIVGGAAKPPVVNVMGVSPFDWSVTAQDAATAVAGGDLFEQLRWHSAGGAPKVVWGAVGVAQDDMDPAVTQVGGGARW